LFLIAVQAHAERTRYTAQVGWMLRCLAFSTLQWWYFPININFKQTVIELAIGKKKYIKSLIGWLMHFGYIWPMIITLSYQSPWSVFDYNESCWFAIIVAWNFSIWCGFFLIVRKSLEFSNLISEYWINILKCGYTVLLHWHQYRSQSQKKWRFISAIKRFSSSIS
jgi:hypothetical protein